MNNPRELHLDDIDPARVAALRHAALHNPIIGSVTEWSDGKRTTRVLRLRDARGSARRRIKRLMDEANRRN